MESERVGPGPGGSGGPRRPAEEERTACSDTEGHVHTAQSPGQHQDQERALLWSKLGQR